MRLSLWNYENAGYIGVVNVAKSMKRSEVILVAPPGDGYVNVILSMFKRFLAFNPVEICPVGKEELSRGTDNKIQKAIESNYRRNDPQIIFVVSTSAAEMLKIDIQSAVEWAGENIPVPVISIPVNSFTDRESEAIDKTMLELVTRYARPGTKTKLPSVNLIGSTFLGFHEQANLEEMIALLNFLNVGINVIFPWKTDLKGINTISSAWANVTWSPESSEKTLSYLNDICQQPFTQRIPIGVEGVRSFINELSHLLQKDLLIDKSGAIDSMEKDFGIISYLDRVSNYRESINAEQLRRKRAFIFGSFGQASAIARFLHNELNFPVISAGTYSAAYESRMKKELSGLPIDVFSATDFLEVRKRVSETQPDLILGTQMERHIAADLGIPCVTISPPVHLETFPLGFQPFIGLRGASHLADLVAAPMNLGLEDDLKKMFSENETDSSPPVKGDLEWDDRAVQELKKIPFFVRKKAQKVIEEYAQKKGLTRITVEVMYEAKEKMLSH